MTLLEKIFKVRNYIERDDGRPEGERRTALALIQDRPDLIAMWRSLERNTGDSAYDDLWIFAFLGAATRAANLPKFHDLDTKARAELSSRLATKAAEFANLLDIYGLDVHLVCLEGTNFNGFYFLEDFSDSNQARILDDKRHRVKVSSLVKSIAKRAEKKISKEAIAGKAGKNAKAIRFVRIMAARNELIYGSNLNSILATATNALFATTYTDADIINLLTRGNLQSS